VFSGGDSGRIPVESVKAVIGLGNPGPEYRNTRHNVGFGVIDALVEGRLKRWKKSGRRLLGKGQAAVAVAEDGASRTEEKILLVKPMGFMNRSGAGAALAMKKYELSAGDVIVVCDDVNLRLGRIRLRSSGSAGGQKGLASVIETLGTEEIPRLRLGVGGEALPEDLTDYVLGRFEADEREAAAAMVDRAAEAVLCWMDRGIEEAMNRFNG